MITTLRKRELPLAPEDIHISATTPNTLEFDWKPPRNARHDLPIYGYEVCYQAEGQPAKRRLVDGFTTTYKIHGLRPNCFIQGILVRGRNEFGWGTSNLPALTGRSAPAPPGQVDWIEVTDTGPYSASLKWSKPEEDHGAVINNYKIRYYQPGNAAAYCEVETASGDCDYMCWALKPGTPYFFSVCAQNIAGWGPWVSLNAYGLTKSAPPDEPKGLRVTRCSVNAVHLAWRPPFHNGSKVVMYEVIYQDMAGRTRSSLVRPNAFTAPQAGGGGAEGEGEEKEERQVVEGLEAGTLLYRIQVRAKNLAGWGAFSRTVSACTTGMLVAWGLNAHGQLGSDPDAPPPAAAGSAGGGGGSRAVGHGPGYSDLEMMRDVEVAAMAAGGRHSVAVGREGEVLTWGANDHGQLGRVAGGAVDWRPGRVELGGRWAMVTGSATETMSDELCKFTALPVTRQDGPADYLGSLGSDERSAAGVVAAAAGSWHTLLVTSLGEVYTCGRGDMGALGLGDDLSVVQPRRVEWLRGVVVTAVACGERHSACLADGGAVYTWGCGADGQLGHGRRGDEHVPRRLEAGAVAGRAMSAVACGARHTAVIDSDGQLLTFGEGRDGRLGHGGTETAVAPRTVLGLSGVTSVACGRYHTACVAAGGALYTFGAGTMGQLGYADGAAPSGRLPSTLGASAGGPWKQLLPRCVTTLLPGRGPGGVRQAVCGPECTAAVTRDAGLWVWGSGPAVAALTESNRPVMEPVRVPRFREDLLSMLAAGETHAMAVLTKFSPDSDLLAAADDADDPAGGGGAEGEETHRICEGVEEACFAARRSGYPVVLAATEGILLLYLAGRRETATDSGVRQCYTEAQLRHDFKHLFATESRRLQSRAAARPALALARQPRDAPAGEAAAAAEAEAEAGREVEELEAARQAVAHGVFRPAVPVRRGSVVAGAPDGGGGIG